MSVSQSVRERSVMLRILKSRHALWIFNNSTKHSYIKGYTGYIDIVFVEYGRSDDKAILVLSILSKPTEFAIL